MRSSGLAFLLLAVLLALGSLPGLASEKISNPVEGNHTTAESLQTMLEERWIDYSSDYPNFPGGIALLVVSVDDSYFASCGIEGESTENTHFRAASITKTLTAAGILLLQQRGLLNIEDTVNSNIPGRSEPYLPDTPQYAIPYGDSITIRQLLEHRAGVFDISNCVVPESSEAPYAGQNYLGYILPQDFEHTVTFDELAGVIASNQLSIAPPGTGYSYSDTGYSLLGKIIEHVSGESFGDFITKNLLLPNGLHDSSLPYLGTDQTLPFPFTIGYDYYGGEFEPVCNDNPSWQVANGNLVTTPADLAEWGKRLYTGKAGLESEYVKMMMDVKRLSDTGGYGLGCEYIEGIGYGHSGAVSGYLSMMSYDPDHDLSTVVFANVMNWDDLTNQMMFFRGLIRQVQTTLRGRSEM